jgi:L-amino acid N-acyltransferase YncA
VLQRRLGVLRGMTGRPPTTPRPLRSRHQIAVPPTGPPEVSLRTARAGDAARAAAIYNQGIEDRVATFETTPRTPEDVAGWIEEALPFVVAVSGDEVVGFARLTPYSDRCVYEGVGEHGVYVARDARGKGVGTRLLHALAAEAEAAGYYKLTSRIFSDNKASLAAHRASGFEEVGLQRRHGRLDGAWKDCVLVERLLGPAASAQDAAA